MRRSHLFPPVREGTGRPHPNNGVTASRPPRPDSTIQISDLRALKAVALGSVNGGRWVNFATEPTQKNTTAQNRNLSRIGLSPSPPPGRLPGTYRNCVSVRTEHVAAAWLKR
jgi:hypothetical protein